MYRLGVMGEPCKAEDVFHGGGRRGGEDVVVGTGGGGGDDLVSEAAASLDSGVSSGSLCSSIMSSLTDDDAESSPVVGDCTWSSSSSSGEDTMQLDGDGGGPLYELSPLLAHLPVRFYGKLTRMLRNWRSLHWDSELPMMDQCIGNFEEKSVAPLMLGWL